MSSPDISQLTSAQQEALQAYTSVTDQDPLEAIPVLQRAEWNVQIAITRFFDGEPVVDPLAEASSATPPTSSRQATNLQYEALLAASRPPATRSPEDRVEKVDTSAAAVTQQQPSFLLSALLVPFNLVYRILRTIFSPFGFLVPTFISRTISRLLTQQSRPTRRTLPPADNAARFVRDFSEQYGSNTLPFVESGFNLTLDNAKKDAKFLLVILLSPDHDENSSWVRNTLLSEQVSSFLQAHQSDILLWGGNVQDTEAYQVSASLQCTKFPFAALICESSDTGSSGMTVVMRAAGPMNGPELVAKIGSALTAHQSQLRAARSQRAEQQASRSLRQEQDSAYERSLAQDRERARVRREEQEAAQRAEQEALRATEAAETRQRKIEEWRKWRAQSLPEEPGAEVKDVVRVSIRLRSGERLIRKFRAEADLEELYAFVDCHGFSDLVEDGVVASEPAGYDHTFDFRLVSPMPRTVFEMADGGSLGERLGKSANLIVESIYEDEDDTQ
jgi:FAS-associated factor 2